MKNDDGSQGRGAPIKVPEPKYQLPPEGLKTGRCVGVADIGTHYYQEKKYPKVILTFELPEDQTVFVEERGLEPFHQSKIYTNSLGEKSNLYKDIVAWQGKGAIERLRDDLGLLVGAPCMLNLTRETKAGKTRSVIIGITPLPRGKEAPAQISPSLTYSIRDGVGPGRYDKLPAWIQKMILDSEEIDGEKPSKKEIAERNVREATDHAGDDDNGGTEQPASRVRGPSRKVRPHPPVGINESSADLEDQLNAELAATKPDWR